MPNGCKRSGILRAAQELIAANGFHGSPTAVIAERAHVAEGTIYRYFENKDHLIRECYRDLEERLSVALMDDYPWERPLRERFIHIARAFVRHCLAFPVDYRYLEQFHNSPFGAAHRRDKVLASMDSDILADLFEEARRQQIVKDLPDPALFALGFGPLVNLIRDHIFGFVELDGPLGEKTIHACWDAVRM